MAIHFEIIPSPFRDAQYIYAAQFQIDLLFVV